MSFLKIVTSSVLFFTALFELHACDFCGCYSPDAAMAHPLLQAANREKPYALYASLGEQFTHFGTDRFNGREVPNPTGEYLDSSITQLVLGATFFDHRLGLQINVPFIARSFRRPTATGVENGHVSGLGDLTLLASYIVFRNESAATNVRSGLAKDEKTIVHIEPVEPDFEIAFLIQAGVKLPTGATSRLKENFVPEGEGEGPESGIHGHDLTLGTGSVDGIFGAQFDIRYRRFFFQADVQYALRGPGAHQYRFANDLAWNGGPGFYLIRKSRGVLGLQCVVSGETKGYDYFEGEPDLDTGATTLYVGPRITGSLGRFSGEIGVDLPVLMHTTQFQSTPDYRIRAGFSVHF